jgi:hypothetical protein
MADREVGKRGKERTMQINMTGKGGHGLLNSPHACLPAHRPAQLLYFDIGSRRIEQIFNWGQDKKIRQLHCVSIRTQLHGIYHAKGIANYRTGHCRTLHVLVPTSHVLLSFLPAFLAWHRIFVMTKQRMKAEKPQHGAASMAPAYIFPLLWPLHAASCRRPDGLNPHSDVSSLSDCCHMATHAIAAKIAREVKITFNSIQHSCKESDIKRTQLHSQQVLNCYLATI